MGHSINQNDTHMEQALIGSLLINPDCRADVALRIPPEAFYSEAHSNIYKAILDSNGGDPVSVINHLHQEGILEKVGGREYVTSLAVNTWTSAGARHYSEQLTSLYQRRMLVEACNSTIQAIKDGSQPEDAMADLRADLRQIDEQGDNGDVVEYRDVIKAVMNDVAIRADSQDHAVGISSGYDVIDEPLMGFEPKTLTYIIGRPSMGKTALALNMADNMATSDSGLVLFFSLEMGSEAIMRRSLSAESNVYLSRIRSGNFEGRQLDMVSAAASRLYDKNIRVMDHPKWKNIEMMAAVIEKIAGEKPLSAIFVDHIQLMRSSQRFNNRHLEISYVSNELKSISKAHNVPVLALSQLNRQVTKGATSRPKLSHMKESGDLEQDADVVLSVYRENREADKMEVVCLKGRDSGTWKGALYFQRFTQKITDWVD
jgi:replicative DNA helicase